MAIKALKWAYNLGQKNTKQTIIRELQYIHRDHLKLAEIADFKKTDRAKNKYSMYSEPHITSREHQAIADAVYAYIGQLEPKSAPNIDWELEKML